MLIESASKYYLKKVRAKAKMYEYGVPENLHIEVEEQANDLILLSIGVVGDISNEIWKMKQAPIILSKEKEEELYFVSRFFDAYFQSEMSIDLNPYYILMGAVTYYFCNMNGSSKVMMSIMHNLNNFKFSASGLENVIIWLLDGNYKFDVSDIDEKYRSYIMQLINYHNRFFDSENLEKVHGTRNEYRQVDQDDYIVAEGIHEAIIPDELWQAAQVKLKAQAKKYEHVNKGKNMRTHLLSGIVKCPICGAGMFGNKSIKYKKDGTKYKDFYYYGCKHRLMNRGHKCTYNKQIREELLDDAVAEVIIKLVSNPKFASMMQEKINMKVDTSAIENEIDNYQKELRKSHSTKFKLIEEIDNLDVEDKHYKRRKNDLDDRLYRMYDKIEELESLLIDAKAKKQTIEAEKLTGDNIYKVLIYFDKLYKVMNDVERRQLITALISEIQIYEEKQPNGQWLKSITFKLPIIDKDLNIGLDNDEQVECVVLLQRSKG